MNDGRRHPRFKLDVEISVRTRGKARLRGHTVDISESGISAMLTIEVDVGALVELEFEPSQEKIYALAVVRQRNAFRYGFQFVEPDAIREVIRGISEQLPPCPRVLD